MRMEGEGGREMQREGVNESRKRGVKGEGERRETVPAPSP